MLTAGAPGKALESLLEGVPCKPSSKPDLRGDRRSQGRTCGCALCEGLSFRGSFVSPSGWEGKRGPVPPGWLRGRLPLRADPGLREMPSPPHSAPDESTTSRHIGSRVWAQHTDWFKEANSPNNSWPGRLPSGQESQPVAGRDPAPRSLAQQPSQTWAEASAGDAAPPLSAPGLVYFDPRRPGGQNPCWGRPRGEGSGIFHAHQVPLRSLPGDGGGGIGVLLLEGGGERPVGVEGATLTAGSPKFFTRPPRAPRGPPTAAGPCALPAVGMENASSPFLLALPPQGRSF